MPCDWQNALLDLFSRIHKRVEDPQASFATPAALPRSKTRHRSNPAFCPPPWIGFRAKRPAQRGGPRL